jgi:hypothetical protein
MKTGFIFLCLLPVLLVTGCVLVPVPSDGKTYGKVITREQVRFIVPGQTTRAEVTERLGDQFRASPRVSAMAYSWEKPAVGVMWGVCVPIYEQAAIAGGRHIERSHWQGFFAAFDEAGQVSRTQFVRLSGGKSLDEQLENWALKKRTHPFSEFARTGYGLFNPETGSLCILGKTKHQCQ